MTIKAVVSRTSEFEKGEVMEFADEIDMLRQCFKLYDGQITVSKSWDGKPKDLPAGVDYEVEFYDDYRE